MQPASPTALIPDREVRCYTPRYRNRQYGIATRPIRSAGAISAATAAPPRRCRRDARLPQTVSEHGPMLRARTAAPPGHVPVAAKGLRAG